MRYSGCRGTRFARAEKGKKKVCGKRCEEKGLAARAERRAIVQYIAFFGHIVCNVQKNGHIFAVCPIMHKI
jgi:hypothetical protein